MGKFTRIPKRAMPVSRIAGTVRKTDQNGRANPAGGCSASVTLYEVGRQWSDAGKRFLLIRVETRPITRYAFQYSGANREEAAKQYAECAAEIVSP